MTDDTRPEAGEPVAARIMSVVHQALDEHGYRYLPLPSGAITLSIRDARGTYTMYVVADEALAWLRVLLSFGSRVPASRRSDVAEAIARINYELYHGGFDLDFADGELRYRQTIDVEDGLLSTTMVDNIIGYALHATEKYHVPLMQVAFGDVDPQIALVMSAAVPTVAHDEEHDA